MGTGMMAPSSGRSASPVAGERALVLARARLGELQPEEIARRAGVPFRPGDGASAFYEFAMLNRLYRVSYPDGSVEVAETGLAPSHAHSLILLHYLLQADGCRLTDRWVAFRELPDALIYDQAFRGRTEPPLMRVFASRLDRFSVAARALGGVPIAFGDAAFMFDALPRLRMAVILCQGDDELPPTARVLYDDAAAHYLPTEDLAVLGGLLVGALIKLGLSQVRSA